MNLSSLVEHYGYAAVLVGALTEGETLLLVAGYAAHRFSGFNPLLNQNLNLPAGAHLTMITELKLTPAVTLITPIWIWIVALLVLAASLAAWVWRKRAQQG